MPRYYVKSGDLPVIRNRASLAGNMTGLFTVLHTDGSLRSYSVSRARATTNRTLVDRSGSRIPVAGEVVGLNLQYRVAGDLAGKRGQVFADAYIAEGSTGTARVWLAQGYLTTTKLLTLGFFEDSLSGKGYLDWVQEANDAAGNVVTTVGLAAANARRIVHAIIVKYHQVGGAAATITITLRDLADSGGPTNWSIESDTWVSPDLVLAANEEGLMHVGEHGFLSTNDAGVLAYADNTTAPNPFPLLVEENDPVDLIIAASGGASGDDYDVWVQYEEWIEA